MTKRRSQAAVDTPYEDRIIWSHHGRVSEGKSRLGRYVFTRNEDGTCDGVSIGPNGVVDMGKQLTDGEAYHGAVEDNKERLGVTGGGSEPGAVRRQRDAPVCPECRTAHNGECL